MPRWSDRAVEVERKAVRRSCRLSTGEARGTRTTTLAIAGMRGLGLPPLIRATVDLTEAEIKCRSGGCDGRRRCEQGPGRRCRRRKV